MGWGSADNGRGASLIRAGAALRVAIIPAATAPVHAFPIAAEGGQGLCIVVELDSIHLALEVLPLVLVVTAWVAFLVIVIVPLGAELLADGLALGLLIFVLDPVAELVAELRAAREALSTLVTAAAVTPPLLLVHLLGDSRSDLVILNGHEIRGRGADTAAVIDASHGDRGWAVA